MRRRLMMQQASAEDTPTNKILLTIAANATETGLRVVNSAPLNIKYTNTSGEIINQSVDIIAVDTGYPTEDAIEISVKDVKSGSVLEVTGDFSYISVDVFYGSVKSNKPILKIDTTECPSVIVEGRGNTSLVSIIGYENSIVSEINSSAFLGCANLSISGLPKDITEIGPGAFRNCSSLNVSEIPSKVTSIGSNAFNGTSIKNIKILNTTKKITGGSTMFTTGTIIQVPTDLRSLYDADSRWNNSNYTLQSY